jgi:hypothetical protein
MIKARVTLGFSTSAIRTSDFNHSSTSAEGAQNGRRPVILPGAPYLDRIKAVISLAGSCFFYRLA